MYKVVLTYQASTTRLTSLAAEYMKQTFFIHTDSRNGIQQGTFCS